MSYGTTSADDMLNLIKERQQKFADRNKRYSDMITVFHGDLVKLYGGLVSVDGDLAMTPNLIKIAWDHYASSVGKVPDKTIRPNGLGDKAVERASKVEQIVHSYDEGDRMKRLIYEQAWWLVGAGGAAMGVLPDFQTKKPRFHVEDPRNVYPSPSFESTYAAVPADTGAGYESYTSTSGRTNNDLRADRASGSGAPYYGGALGDVLVERLTTIRALQEQFPQAALGPSTEENLRREVRVLIRFECYSITMVAIVDRKPVWLTRAEHELGFVPWRFTQTYAPDQVGGISQFEEQVPLLVALTRLWQQKLAYNDATTWPKTYIKGSVNKMSLGPFEYIQLDQNADVIFEPNRTEFQADRDIMALERTIRALNREGGAVAGDIQGGPITGRGIEQLARPGDTLVQHYWNLTSPDLAALYSYALAIDEHFWPDERKPFSGSRKGEEFEGFYIPRKDIAGHRSVSISYGFGVGGIEGFLQALQAMQAGLISEETVMEQMPGVRSVAGERRRVEINRIDRAIFGAFEQGDVPRAQFLAQVKDEVSHGTPLSQALAKIPPPPVPGQETGGIPGLPMAPGGPPGDAEAQMAALAGGAPPQPPDLAALLSSVGGGHAGIQSRSR